MNSDELFRAVLRFVRRVCPGERCEMLSLKLTRGVIKLQPPLMGLSDVEIPTVPPAPVEPGPMPLPREFHPIQVAVLKALMGGKTLKGEAFLSATKVGSRADLYRSGHGVPELRAMGLVDHEQGSGYFLTEKGEEVAEGL